MLRVRVTTRADKAGSSLVAVISLSDPHLSIFQCRKKLNHTGVVATTDLFASGRYEAWWGYACDDSCQSSPSSSLVSSLITHHPLVALVAMHIPGEGLGGSPRSPSTRCGGLSRRQRAPLHVGPQAGLFIHDTDL